MTTIQEIQFHFRNDSSDWLDIILEVHSIVTEIAPDAFAELRNRSVSYYFDERGGPVSAGICNVNTEVDHIRLSFIHGSFLPDPAHILEGNSRYKKYVVIRSYDTAPWNAIKAMIQWSSKFDPYTQSFRK
jgi:hypothetical protein